MKGTDCTPGQLASADAFLSARGWPTGNRAVIARDDLVRLVAWYGALRYIAARDGEGGTLETPGEFVSVPAGATSPVAIQAESAHPLSSSTVEASGPSAEKVSGEKEARPHGCF